MTDNPQQAALKPYRERILALLDKEVAFAEKHLGSYDTEWMKGIRALVMSEPEVSSTPAPVDHAALAEKLEELRKIESRQAIPDGNWVKAVVDAWPTILSALRAHPAGGVSEDDRAYDAMRAFQGGTWKGRPKVFREEELEAMKRALQAAGIGAGVVDHTDLLADCYARLHDHYRETGNGPFEPPEPADQWSYEIIPLFTAIQNATGKNHDELIAMGNAPSHDKG